MTLSAIFMRNAFSRFLCVRHNKAVRQLSTATEPFVMGAVAYDPKVVTIWEGFKSYLQRQGLPFDYVLYSTYEHQVSSLLRRHISVAWNSPLAWVQTYRLAPQFGLRARAIAMRDTDMDLRSVIVVRSDSPIRSLSDLKGKSIGVGAKDSPQATLIPLQHVISASSLVPNKDFNVVEHNIGVGLHGDHVGGERDALIALAAGKVEAACLISSNYEAFVAAGVVPRDSMRVIASTPLFDHCNFTAVVEAKSTDSDPLPPSTQRFVDLLLSMDYSQPEVHRLMDLEGLKCWVKGRTSGYTTLESAVDQPFATEYRSTIQTILNSASSSSSAPSTPAPSPAASKDPVDLAKTIASEVISKEASDVDEKGRWPVESIKALAESGLFGLIVPKEFGGMGCGLRQLSEVLSVIAEQCSSTAMIYLMHSCGTQNVVSSTLVANRDQILRDIAAGKHLSTLAFSERGSRSHFWAPVSKATVDDTTEVVTINASKSWVTAASHADGYVVSSGSYAKEGGVNLYYVPKDTAGFVPKGTFVGLGMRGNDSGPMELKDVRLPTSSMLTPDGEGLPAMLTWTVPVFQLGQASVALGISRGALAATKRHMLKSEFQNMGSASLGSLPTLRARLANMKIKVDTISAMVQAVLHKMETGAPDTMIAVLESKAFAGDTSVEVTDLAMRICGGAAFSKWVGVERYFRDSRACQVMAPTSDVLHDFIARAELDMPLF